RNSNTKQIKRDLNTLGYSGISVTTLFGSFTEKRLKEFQKDFKLPISGIADAKTIAAITTAVKNQPKDKTEYTDYGMSLDKAVDLQSGRPIITTDKYRNDPAYVSANYIELTGSASISGSVVNVRKNPKTTSGVAYQAKKGDKVTITGTKKGTKVSGSTLWYQIKGKNGKKAYVHSSLLNGSTGKVTGTVNVRSGKGSSYHSFGKLSKGSKVSITSKGSSWHQISYNTWRTAKRSDIKQYMDPSKNDKFQHLRLDKSLNVSAKELNNALKNKGILSGKGNAFIKGAKKHNVNEAYLISHATLETGNGSSTLAKGVEG